MLTDQLSVFQDNEDEVFQTQLHHLIQNVSQVSIRQRDTIDHPDGLFCLTNFQQTDDAVSLVHPLGLDGFDQPTNVVRHTESLEAVQV